MSSVSAKPAPFRHNSVSEYSQASAERAREQLDRANSDSPITSPISERAFNVKRASSYRKPVDRYEILEARLERLEQVLEQRGRETARRGLMSASVGELPLLPPTHWQRFVAACKRLLCVREPA